MNQSLTRNSLQSALGLATVAVAIALTVAVWWFWPSIAAQFGAVTEEGETADADAEHAAHENAAEETPILTLTPEARDSLDIVIGPLERGDYQRTLRVPGQIVPIPGVSQRDVTSQTSGEINEVFVRTGQLVRGGDPLFSISLVHEEAVAYQLDLIDALASLEAAKAEIARLEGVLATSPGGAAQRALIEQRYERLRLEHLIESRRNALEMLGVASEEIDHLLETHDPEETGEDLADPHTHEAELIENVTVVAPGKPENEEEEPPVYTVQNLVVHPGEHVDVGHLLCQLGQYERLYIEGQAFEQDLPILRHALNSDWSITGAWEVRDGVKEEMRELPILFLDPVVDEESRSIHFYIELENAADDPRDIGGRPYVDWRFRPGQRMELRVPVQKFEDSLVVPVEAIAQDGLDYYVFQSSGNRFKRHRVVVLHRDQDYAVLAEDDTLYEGMSLAMSGAFQLQLALESQKGSGANVETGHGHTH